MIHVYSVNEWSFFTIALRAGVGLEPWVLSVQPFFPPLQKLLQRLIDKLATAGKIHIALDECSDLGRVRDYPLSVCLYDVFGSTMSEHESFFHFIEAENSLRDDAMAFKQITCNHMHNKHVDVIVIASLLMEPATKNEYRWHGLTADLICIVGAFVGANTQGFYPGLSFRWIFNPASTVLGLLLGWFYVVSHTRVEVPHAKSFFFAADFIDDERDMLLYKEVEDGGSMLMVERMNFGRHKFKLEQSGYIFCKEGEGFFNLKQAACAILEITCRSLRIALHSWRFSPGLAFQAALLPWRRIRLRAFFNQYQPKWFWGRDTYNVQHIIRRQEISRVGGQSLGVNVGYPTYCSLFPMTSYVSFDRYYVFGRGPYDRYLSRTFDPNTIIVPAGTFTATREQFHTRFNERPNDIAICCAIFVGEQQTVEFINDIAAAFPNRSIFLQIKKQFIQTEPGLNLIRACTEEHKNVSLTSLSVYNLFQQVRYVISDPSSVIGEAIQMGNLAFAFDIPEVQQSSIWRDYPGLTVTTGAEFVECVERIEAGKSLYPIEKWGGLIDLSGRYFADIVRADVGLDPKEPPLPLYAFADPINQVGLIQGKTSNV